MNTKYIFVTGGVVSGLGKGITAASLRKIVKKSRKGQSKGQNAEKSPETLGISGLFMAAGEGFEFQNSRFSYSYPVPKCPVFKAFSSFVVLSCP